LSDIALPTGLLLSPFKTWLEKFFLLPTYATSHRTYLRRSGFLVRWHALGSNLEASLSLSSILENDRVPMARIALRSTEADHIFTKISLLVEADSVVGTYQDVITFHKVGSKPAISALSSIPLRAIHITEQLKFFESFDKISVSVLEIEPPPSIHFDPAKVAWFAHPTNIDLLNDRFEERWGTYWNMGAVDLQIRERAHWFTYHLVSPKVYYASTQRVPFSSWPKAVLRRCVGRPLCWLLTRGWLLRAYFWLPILLRMRKFEVKDA
jgi:hypothetical protein